MAARTGTPRRPRRSRTAKTRTAAAGAERKREQHYGKMAAMERTESRRAGSPLRGFRRPARPRPVFRHQCHEIRNRNGLAASPPPSPAQPAASKRMCNNKKKDEEIKEKRRENKKSESSRVLSLKLSLEVSMTFEIGLGFSLCSFSTKWKRRTSFDGLAAARVCRYLFLLYLVFFSLHIRHHGRL